MTGVQAVVDEASCRIAVNESVADSGAIDLEKCAASIGVARPDGVAAALAITA